MAAVLVIVRAATSLSRFPVGIKLGLDGGIGDLAAVDPLAAQVGQQAEIAVRRAKARISRECVSRLDHWPLPALPGLPFCELEDNH